jgi:hypothetical protein
MPPKEGDLTVCKNLRGIVLLSTVSKKYSQGSYYIKSEVL